MYNSYPGNFSFFEVLRWYLAPKLVQKFNVGKGIFVACPFGRSKDVIFYISLFLSLTLTPICSLKYRNKLNCSQTPMN